MISRYRSKVRRKSTFGTVLFAALALSAVLAVGAQAYEWEVGGKYMSEAGLTSETTAGSSGSVELSSEIAKAPVRMTCEASTTGKVTVGGSAEDTVTLSGCVVSEPSNCVISSPITIAAKASLVEAGGSLYRKFTQAEEAKFGTVKIRKCAEEGNFNLTGSFGGSESGSAMVNHSVSLSSAATNAAGAALKLGGNPATLAGTLEQHLTGPSAGMTWRGLASLHSTGPLSWKVNGSPLYSSTAVKLRGGVNFTWTLAGSPVRFGCTSVGASTNTAIGSEGSFSGSLLFSGCSMSEPAGCQISSSWSTNSLKGSLWGGNDGRWYETLTQPNGAQIFNLVVSKCALSGSYPVSGSLTARGGEIGVEKGEQKLTFSPAIDSAAGTQMGVGGNPVSITGSLIMELVSGGSYTAG